MTWIDIFGKSYTLVYTHIHKTVNASSMAYNNEVKITGLRPQCCSKCHAYTLFRKGIMFNPQHCIVLDHQMWLWSNHNNNSFKALGDTGSSGFKLLEGLEKNTLNVIGINWYDEFRVALGSNRKYIWVWCSRQISSYSHFTENCLMI